jgi:hypothetical protein
MECQDEGQGEGQGEDQRPGLGTRVKRDSTNALRREGRVDLQESHDPKELSSDPLRGEHRPERADVTSNSSEGGEGRRGAGALWRALGWAGFARGKLIRGSSEAWK